MGFVKTFDQNMATPRTTDVFCGSEMRAVFWETKPEIRSKVRPPTLKPAAHIVAMALVTNYPATNCDVFYTDDIANLLSSCAVKEV